MHDRSPPFRHFNELCETLLGAGRIQVLTPIQSLSSVRPIDVIKDGLCSASIPTRCHKYVCGCPFGPPRIKFFPSKRVEVCQGSCVDIFFTAFRREFCCREGMSVVSYVSLSQGSLPLYHLARSGDLIVVRVGWFNHDHGFGFHQGHHEDLNCNKASAFPYRSA